ARQHFRELVEARARARALRVREEDERWTIGGGDERGVGGPARRSLRGGARTVVVAPYDEQAGNDADQPDDGRHTEPDRAHSGTLRCNTNATGHSLLTSSAAAT